MPNESLEAADASRQPLAPADLAVAARLHSAALHLLRRLRAEDAPAGLTAPRLSALSVVVFAGRITPGELAAAEQVRPPTVSRLVRDLEAEGLVRRRRDPRDRRVRWLEATAAGRRLLAEGRRRRVSRLAREVAALGDEERRILDRAAGLLERLALPPGHPRQRPADGGAEAGAGDR